MSKIETKYDPERQVYKISGHISTIDLILDPHDILREVRYKVTQEIIDHAAAKLRERFESELDKALNTMFSEEM